MPFVETETLQVKEPSPGWKGRFFHSAHMTFAHYSLAAGAAIHEHSHPNDEVWNVLAGQIEISIDGVTKLLGPGEAAVVPPGARHAVRATKRARVLVVDHPRRSSIGGVEL